MDWLDALQRFREARTPAVLVTLATVRGHAPRNGGAKMVVSSDDAVGSVGGGNLEETAVRRAREMLDSGASEPELLTLTLSDRAVVDYGVQCCGGEVTMLLEPVPVVPTVAVFGVGHVGFELARVLARHPLRLELVDSRAEMLSPDRLGVPGRTGPFADAIAELRLHHLPVPESALADLPAGAHVLVMTHDHAEDLAICDMALRTTGLGSIGLIGSRSKWARFRTRLREAGHEDAALERITTPIGIAGIRSKEPAAIAVSVAARVLQLVEEAARPAPAAVSPPTRARGASPAG
ncbi:xanthine dehydrogenase accessory protein XdhC [Agromyces arachidis]|uniref:xanthine dehydrogenase accessory protein XdhC n=1 Tax=Agromyces arachidis TaxID=766966 RepID=UPI004056E230